MSQIPQNPPSVGSSADLTAALQQAEKELATLKAKLQSSSRMTAVVGVLVLALLSGYFYYGYTQINEVLQPKKLVDATSSYLDDQLPEIRQQLETQIKDHASEWIQTISDQAFESIPGLRGAAEDFAISQLNEVFDQVASLTEDEFKKFLTDNRELLETTFKELADNPKVSDELLKQLETALDEQLGGEMKTKAEDLLAMVTKLADEVESLKDGKNLGDLERRKLNILKIAKRLQVEQGLQKDEDEVEMLKDAVKGTEEKEAS